MSTLTARRRAHARDNEQVKLRGLCRRCRQPIRGVGGTFSYCAGCRHFVNARARTRYNRNPEYGAAFTVAVVRRALAVEMRGLA